MFAKNSIVFVILATFLANARVPCHPRYYGKGKEVSYVCVCNVTYCDDLSPIKKTTPGLVTLYETSRDGGRLNEITLHWGFQHNDNTTLWNNITINRNIKYQKIIGFGGSFTDSTGYNILTLPKSLQDHIVDDLFSEKGLEHNLNRLSIGGADFSVRAYSLDDNATDDFELEHFSLQQDDYLYKIPFMKAAMRVGTHPQKFFGSPWSAPAWMKNNSELNHGGWLYGKPGEKYYKTFAKYFVKFLDSYKKEGLSMWGITIENEPKAGYIKTYSFNSMGFTKELQRDFIKLDLGPTLEKAGYGVDKLELMIFDDQRDHIYEWAKTIYSDPDASKYSTGTAYHWYNNRPNNLDNLNKVHNLESSKFIVNTESSNAEGVNPTLGTWRNIEAYVTDMITVLNHWVQGYVHWNMVLDLQGGPTWNGGTADAPIIANPEQNEYYKQPSYYGLAHVMKFLPPDSIRVNFTQVFDMNKLLTTVFERPDGGVVVIVINTSEVPIEYNIIDDNKILSNVIHGRTVQTYLYY